MKSNLKKLFQSLIIDLGIAVLITLITFVIEKASDPSLPWLKIFNYLLSYLIILVLKDLVVLILNSINPKQHRARTLLTVLKSLVNYIGIFAFAACALKFINIDPAAILAGVGILALIIGFGAESLIADAVTGIFMIFENQYNVGDYIEVGGFRGKVTSIGIRTTCLEDAGGNVKIVNNSAMTNILNRSDHSSKAVSVIGIPYETDLEALEEKIPELMTSIYEKHQDTMLAAPIYLGVNELADSSVNLKFVVEVEDKNIFSAARILNHDLFIGFKKLGIEVPFPQVDVHQK